MHSAPRLARLRDRLAAEPVDAMLVTEVRNIAYLTGFEGVFDEDPAHVALVTAHDALLITDSRYVEALSSAAAGSAWRVQLAEKCLSTTCAHLLGEVGAARVALETSQPHERFSAFCEAIEAEIVEASGWVEELRIVKDAEEIAAISDAQALTDRGLEFILPRLHAGAIEREIALELEFFMRREGSEGVAFAPIVASGPNSALPHAMPGTRALAAGDFVVLDFGARVRGYCADMTRTVMIGRASERQREIYDAVLAAQLAGVSALAAGRTGKEVDAIARGVLGERGLGEYFGHGLGHGVGLDIHEQPGVGPRSQAALPAGAVVTVEPGVYIPGFGGVRIEDLAVVREGGAEVLTRSAKALLEL